MAVYVRDKFKAGKTRLDPLAEWLARLTGSWTFVLLHVLLVMVWFLFEFSENLLTLILSLEAIFLVTILLMVSNREAERDNLRDDADFQADLHSEREIGEVKRILLEIKERLNRLETKR